MLSEKGKATAARKWLLNVVTESLDGRLSVHSQPIPLQVMGDYALRPVSRLKKVDKSHIERLMMPSPENPMAANAITLPGPSRKRSRPYLSEITPNDSRMSITMQNMGQNNQRKELIQTMVELQVREWDSLSMDTLNYEYSKLQRLQPNAEHSV